MSLKEELENYWYHNKWYTLLIIFIVVFAVLSGNIGRSREPEAEYTIGIVSAAYYNDEALAALRERLRERHGTTEVKYYQVDLSAETSDEDSRVQVSLLDADLMMKQSSDFLLEDVEAFESATNGLEISEAVQVRDIPELAGLGFDELWFVSRR